MSEEDYNIIKELEKKAANSNWYGVAIYLKKAAEELERKFKDKWTQDVISSIEPD